MQSDKSAKVVRGRTTDPDADERERMAKGQELKRYVRAAVALRGLFDDRAIAAALGLSRNTVGHWWTGAVPEPKAVSGIARLTGYSEADLFAYLYAGGPPPAIASAWSSGVQEGIRRDQERQRRGDHPGRARSPEPRPRGTGAGRG